MRTFSLIFVLAFLAGCGHPQVVTPMVPVDRFPATIERVKQSVVPIVCAIGTAPESVEGTAFFVDREGRFVTANHVLSAMEALPPRARPCQSSALYIPVDGWGRMPGFPVKLLAFKPAECARDAFLDLAVCRVSSLDGMTPVPVVFGDNDADGVEVAFTGFPMETAWPLTLRANVASLQMLFQGFLMTLYFDKTAVPGASGAPLYTVEGRVVGMVVARGVGSSAGLGLARSAAAIQWFLKQHGVPPASH